MYKHAFIVHNKSTSAVDVFEGGCASFLDRILGPGGVYRVGDCGGGVSKASEWWTNSS